MTENGSSKLRLADILGSAIPSCDQYKYQVHYLSTPPCKHPSLYLPQQLSKSSNTSSKPSSSGTTCQHHLLLLSHNSKFILALEILIYRIKAQSPIIYISKADTTGYSPSNITRPITTAFLQYLLRLTGSGIIQLFARSQSQYIFPCSADNGKKHILDDTQLIKWWLRVLSPFKGSGKVFIPGVDRYKIKSYYPMGGQVEWECIPPGAKDERWEKEGGLAQDVVPVFPDDPKARFLNDLRVDEQLSSTSLKMFWELMEHRQECSSGRLVGFISVFVQGIEKKEVEEGVVVDEKTFLRAYEMILNGDYSNEETSTGATMRWIEAILAIIPKEMQVKWGFELIPSGKEVENGKNGEGNEKKRPAEEVKPVNMLGGSFVRKKPKT